MIQLILNATPEKATFSFDWNSIIALFAGALIAVFIDYLKSRHTEQQERKEFKQIKKRIPEVIKVIKKGLNENPLATELAFDFCSKDCKDPINYDVEIDYYYISFGECLEKVSEEIFNKGKDIKDFLVAYDFAHKKEYGRKFIRTKLILNSEFLTKVERWG